MRIDKKRILTVGGVLGMIGLAYVCGSFLHGVRSQSDYYHWLRVDSASRANYKLSLAASLRGGDVKKVVENLEADAALDLWHSSRNQWWKTPLEMSRWSPDTIKLWQEAKSYYDQYPETINRNRPTNISEVRELLKQIPPLEREGLGRDFAKTYQGKTPPALRIAEWIGPAATLEDLRGKVVLLDFWHIECPGCVARMADMQRLRDRFNEKGLRVLGIHSARVGDFTEVPEFLRTHQYDLPVGLDDQYQTESNYAVQAWPTYYLIDRQGNLAWGPSHDIPGDEILRQLISREE